VKKRVMKAKKGKAIDLDKEIGERIRARRIEMDMSQVELGALMGLTFQQIQKYERGKNRLAASRLPLIAETLDVPITYFFGGDNGKKKPIDFDTQTLRVARLYSKLKKNDRILVKSIVRHVSS